MRVSNTRHLNTALLSKSLEMKRRIMTKRSANQITIAAALAIAVAITLVISISNIPTGSAQATVSANPTTQEEKPFDQGQKIAELTKQIAGKENQPAEQVFKNI